MTAVDTSTTDTGLRSPAIVLFVDEEADILAGFRATLRRHPNYETRIAQNHEDALAIVRQEAVDVVVTEIRLPGHDGIELLKTIMEISPSTVRYVLTGEVEEAAVLRAATVAHRWLSKPCSREQLIQVLDDALHHQKIITDPALRRALTETTALPTPPQLYAELLALVAKPSTTMDEIASLVARDAAVSAKLLQWANSAFSASSPTVNLKEAVVRIGLSAVTQLVLLVEVAAAFDGAESIPGMDTTLLEEHMSLISSTAGKMVDAEMGPITALGGLFANIGLLLEASHLPERLAESYAVAEDEGMSLVEAEKELFGVSHPEIGAHMLSLWGLPSELVLLAAGSHQPPSKQEPVSAVDAVRLARLLTQRVHRDRLGVPHIDRCSPEVEDFLNGWSECLAHEVNAANAAATAQTPETQKLNEGADHNG
ncbi:MAG: HDOD domain-containing protein [Acidimicrobiales bacterium]